VEDENCGAGVYSMNLKKSYILVNDEWNEDVLHEILDGLNVYDFIDPYILHSLMISSLDFIFSYPSFVSCFSLVSLN